MHRLAISRRDDDVGRVYPLGEIPQPLAPDAPSDRDLPAHQFTRTMIKAVQAELEDLASWLGLGAVEPG